MPPEHPKPITEHVDTMLKAFTESPRGHTVLRVNNTRVVLSASDGESTLVMQAHICPLPRHSGPRAALCEALLLATTRLGHSDRLGIEPTENAVVYQRMVDIDIDTETLGHALWDLIAAAEQIRHSLGHD